VPFDASHAAALLNELPEALFVATLQGEILYVNRALEELTGYRSSDLVGHGISKLMPQPARRRVQVIDWLGRWAEDPNPEQLRYLNLEAATSSGEIRVVSVRVSKHSEAEQTWFLVVLRDVTSQHESAVAMRHAQLVTNRILAIGEDAIVSMDARHRMNYCNPSAERLFGYSRSEMIGRDIAMLLPPEVAERHGRLIDEFAGGTEASRLMGERGEIAGRRKDGSLVPLEISITKTTMDGEVVLSAQIRDITERKRAERAIRDSEARFRAVFENAMEAMALLSPAGEVLEINAAARGMLPEFRAEEPFWALDWWGRGRDDEATRQSRENLKTNIERCAAGEVIRVRVSLAGVDAASREIDFSLIPVSPVGEGVVYILAEGRDITSLL
jgi:PAS domain S-box-containing protein